METLATLLGKWLRMDPAEMVEPEKLLVPAEEGEEEGEEAAEESGDDTADLEEEPQP